MNKELLFYFSVVVALVVGALYYNNAIQSPILSSLNSTKSTYHDITESISHTIDQHFFQAEEIETLKTQLRQYENNHLVMQQLASEIHDLYKENKSDLKTSPGVELVRTISYQKFGNLNRVWIEVQDYNKSKIYGLTYKELVAGIVINMHGKPLALLNRDIKSAYSVYIGENHAPGIAHGNNDEYLIVDFIPTWYDIKKGDEVTTSGLDNIFFKGLKVGRVLSVTSSQGYQNAVIEQYYQDNEPSYFHMIRELK